MQVPLGYYHYFHLHTRYEDWRRSQVEEIHIILWSFPIQDDPRSKHFDAMGQWKNLPSEIIELVITKLPIADIFRVQTTNRHMYELVKRMLHNSNSPPLSLRSRGETTSFLTGQLMIPCEPIDASGAPFANEPLVFQPETKARNVKLPQLSSYLPFSRRPKNVTVFAGNGGLLLLGVSARHGMIVCNPLTKSWRDLTPLPTRLPHTQLSKLFLKVVMVDKSKNSYKVALFTKSAWFMRSRKCYSLVYTPESLEWKYKEHDNGNLPNKRFLHVAVDDVDPNLAHALVFDMKRRAEVEIVTFDAKAMEWTPWGFNDLLVPNHPSCIAKVYTLLVQDGVVYVVVAQSFYTPSGMIGVWALGTWMTILRLERHASKPTARKLTETYFDDKYYECFERDSAENQPWFIWKSTSRRAISKICRDEIVEYDILSGTWSRHQAQDAGACRPQSDLTQVGYEECWMNV